MKKYIISLLTCLIALHVCAQPITHPKGKTSGDIVHVISCDDIRLDTETQAVAEEHLYFSQTFCDSINLNTTFTAVSYPFTGSNVTASHLVDRIENMKVTSNDVIVFHFCGKGVTMPNDSLPAMFLASDSVALDHGNAVFLTDIIRLLLAKPHRLLLVVCESGREPVSSDNVGMQTPSRIDAYQLSDLTNYTYRPKGGDNGWQQLFGQAGNFVLMACKTGQAINQSPGHFLLGYYMQAAFDSVYGNKKTDWPSFLEGVANRTRKMASSLNIDQSPYWFEIKLKRSSYGLEATRRPL